MPITYDSSTNTITVVGSKNGSPYTFEDIYQADVNNGWGVFTKLSEGVYKTTAKIRIGDGSTETYFEDKLVSIIADNVTTSNDEWWLRIEAKAHVQFGEIYEVNGKFVTYNGVTFLMRNTDYGDMKITVLPGSNVKFYNCAFHGLRDTQRLKIQCNDAELVGCSILNAYCIFSNSKIINCEFTGYYTHLSPVVGNTIENVFIYTYYAIAFWLGNATRTIRNVYSITKERLASVDRLRDSSVVKFVNCKPHNWTVTWRLLENETSGELQRVYAVRFKVTDINGNLLSGRTVKIYDKNGNKIAEATTNSNGETDETEILYAKLTNPYSDGTWHKFTDEDWEYFNPFTIEVWHGSELEYKGILTDLDVDSTYIHITVKPSSFTLQDINDRIEFVRKLVGNRWKIENNQLLIFDDDNETIIRRFDLKDKQGNPTETNVYDRIPKE